MDVGQIDIAAARTALAADERRVLEQLASLDERAAEAQTPGEVAFSSGETLLDDASLAVERERELALRQTLQARLTDVRAALSKIERGSYGRCDACGGPISPQRLRAQPHTSFCITCKEKAERRR